RDRAYRALTLSAATETSYLKSSLEALLAERARLTAFLLDAGYSVRTDDAVTVKVVATGYSSSIRETDSTPFITASNTQTRLGILAMSRDLLKRYTAGAPFDFGDHVHVPGLGEFIVEDSMNSRWNNRIDIWFPSRMDALRFGIKEVYVKTLDEEQIVSEELTENEPSSTVKGL
ncbi:MAG: 3D domain-containing protein, partial [Candidatus Krumholzibacteria bacterium]|nr:3D domain-containing protein [Candidatus Krumholzibacteria bacterium]